MHSPLSQLELAEGATLSDYLGCTLPSTFSNFNAEYRAARESVALFDANWHATLTLSGPDRVRYLNAIVTNDIKSLSEGSGTLALLLNPQGHILAELEIYALKEKLLVRTHASVREKIIQVLDKFIIMDDVTLEDASDQLSSLALEGPQAATIIAQSTGLSLEGFSEMAHVEVVIDGVPCHLIRRSHFSRPSSKSMGAEIIAPREKLAIIWQNLRTATHAQHGAPIGMEALNALRLEAGIPCFPADFNDTVIPHEAALEATHISFTKGCYTGQEIVERVRSRGHVNRRRVQLKFANQAPPARATRLRADGNEVGLVTSAAFSPSAGTAIGMGYIRREHNSPGSVVEYDGGTATVIDRSIRPPRASSSRENTQMAGWKTRCNAFLPISRLADTLYFQWRERNRSSIRQLTLSPELSESNSLSCTQPWPQPSVRACTI